MNNNTPNNLRIDPSTIAQTFLIATLLALTTTVLQLRQDVALLRDQMQNFILAKEFAAFKAITEQLDQQIERRMQVIERQLETKK